MARNHEKQYGRLNRLILWKENEEYEKKNPQRPKLNSLDTPEEIKKWLPSIKRDLNFYLKKSQVICYSNEHIEECKVKINNLEKEYKAFVRKISQLTPGKLDAVPWTNRAYKRKNNDSSDQPLKKEKEFVPIPTPILSKVKVSEEEVFLPVHDLPFMDKPLTFNFDKEKNSAMSNSETINHNTTNISGDIDKIECDHKNLSNSHQETKQSIAVSIPSSENVYNLVNYDDSSDDDS